MTSLKSWRSRLYYIIILRVKLEGDFFFIYLSKKVHLVIFRLGKSICRPVAVLLSFIPYTSTTGHYVMWWEKGGCRLTDGEKYSFTSQQMVASNSITELAKLNHVKQVSNFTGQKVRQLAVWSSAVRHKRSIDTLTFHWIDFPYVGFGESDCVFHYEKRKR